MVHLPGQFARKALRPKGCKALPRGRNVRVPALLELGLRGEHDLHEGEWLDAEVAAVSGKTGAPTRTVLKRRRSKPRVPKLGGPKRRDSSTRPRRNPRERKT